MKIRFVFYVAKFEWRNFLKTRKIHLVDDAISWWTWLFNWFTKAYAHVEVWLPETDASHGFEWQNMGEYQGACLTSTMRGEDKGTCCRPASEVFKHPERWHYKEFDLTPTRYNIGLIWAKKQVKENKGYGFKDIIGKFFLFGLIADKLRNICSEFCYNYAVMVYIFAMPFKVVSPRRLWKKLPGKTYRLIDNSEVK